MLNVSKAFKLSNEHTTSSKSSGTVSAVTSNKFKACLETKRDAAQIRIQARAKEAHAIAQLFRLAPAGDWGALSLRLAQLETELLNQVEIAQTDDPTDLQVLSQSSSLDEFCTEFARTWPRRYKLHDVIAKSLSNKVTADTRHQDAKDIERDALIVGQNGNVTLFGSNVGYDGAVNAIAADIAELCGESSNSSAIVRFARVLLNASNRTTSGGDAFEAIERFVKPPHLVFVAPDSSGPIDPIRISCRLGAFRTPLGWDWGICGRTQATTRYCIYGLEDVDRRKPLAKIEGRCLREFGMALPLPEYDDPRVYNDDGKCLVAREWYECDDGGLLELSGSVITTPRSVASLFDDDDDADLDKALL